MGVLNTLQMAMRRMAMSRASSTGRSLAWAIALTSAMSLATATVATAQSDPPLIPGDLLNVEFLEHPELTGERAVEGDGTIAFPSGERVRVAGLSLSDAEAAVRRDLAEGRLLNPAVSLTVVERVPVAVLGDVRAPGEYPYKHNMKVLRAIAAAGGYGATASAADRAEQRSREYADMSEMLSRINALKARLARLDAELNGEFFAPNENERSNPFVSAEEELAHLRRTEHNAERSVLLSQITPVDERIKLLRAQIESQREQVRLFSEQLAKIEDLTRRGLSTSNTLLDKQLTRSRMETDLLAQQAQLANAQQDRSRLEKELTRLDATMRRGVSEDRRQALEELSVLYERFRYASLAAGDVTVTGLGGAAMPSAPSISHIITVVRDDEGDLIEFAAGEKTPLLPGDIVRVRSVLLDGSIESSFTGLQQTAQQ